MFRKRRRRREPSCTLYIDGKPYPIEPVTAVAYETTGTIELNEDAQATLVLLLVQSLFGNQEVGQA